jgi:hypothetical protein
MREIFKEKAFVETSLELIENCNDIVGEYQRQGLRLTLRQLYYQLVTKNIIANVERAYKNLSSLVSDARLAGHIDWDAIEDRIRIPDVPTEFKDLGELVEAALYSYRLPRWVDQEYYVELWVEKDALAGVLRPLAKKHHVTLMVNRGYSSQSAMYEASRRFLDKDGRTGVLLYLGDFDPSGEDMVRDIKDRMEMFGVDLAVVKVALTLNQVKVYNPPPNPAKRKDPRSKEFIKKYGASSWEVDALPPTELHKIIEAAMKALVDKKKMKMVIKMEEDDKAKLREAVKQIMEGGN